MTEDEPSPSVAPPDPLPVDGGESPGSSTRGRSSNWLYLVTVALLVVGAAFMVLNSGEGESSVAFPTMRPIPTSTVNVVTPTAVPEPTVAEPTVAEPTTVAAAPVDEPTPSEKSGSPITLGAIPADPAARIPDEAPADLVEIAAQIAAGEAPESRGVLLGGRIFLLGTVPDQASADALATTAATVVGADNVFNHYYIDPHAKDAGLGIIRVDDHVRFASGSVFIAPEFEPILTQVLFLMAVRPEVTVEVIGYSDDQGSADHNQSLSEQRAAAVEDWLTGRGVAPERVTSEGRGDSDPIASNDTPEGRQANRRIQFFIANLS